jgi:RNA polymerase sigma-70 factor (ECF subfamily)
VAKDLEDIINGARLGDRNDISALIDHFEGELLRFAVLLTRDANLAQDLCQDAFVRLIERIHKLKDPNKCRPWLYKILKNIFFDYIKKASFRNEICLEDIEDSISVSLLDNEEALVHISRVLNDLSHEDQMIILLSDLEKHEATEIAEIMGKSIPAVNSHLHRARKHFMTKFSNNRTNDELPFVCINEALKNND